MDEYTLVYLILALFAVNYTGMASMWSKIDKLNSEIEKIKSCLIVAGCKELQT